MLAPRRLDPPDTSRATETRIRTEGSNHLAPRKNAKNKATAATISRLLAACHEGQFVVVVYDEHGKVRVPPKIAPVQQYSWAGVGRTRPPVRTLLEIHDLPEPDEADEDAPVSRLVVTHVAPLSRGGAA
jgi:hypothetical protein